MNKIIIGVFAVLLVSLALAYAPSIVLTANINETSGTAMNQTWNLTDGKIITIDNTFGVDSLFYIIIENTTSPGLNISISSSKINIIFPANLSSDNFKIIFLEKQIEEVEVEVEVIKEVEVEVIKEVIKEVEVNCTNKTKYITNCTNLTKYVEVPNYITEYKDKLVYVNSSGAIITNSTINDSNEEKGFFKKYMWYIAGGLIFLFLIFIGVLYWLEII